MNDIIYYHLENESNNAEALIRVCLQTKKVRTIAGSTFYEKFFCDGQLDTLTDMKINILLVGGRACHPAIGELIDRIGPKVNYSGPSETHNGTRIPDDVSADVKRLRNDGYSVVAVSKQLGISRPTVYKYS